MENIHLYRKINEYKEQSEKLIDGLVDEIEKLEYENSNLKVELLVANERNEELKWEIADLQESR